MVETTAVNAPTLVGCVERVTVNDVAVAALTAPTAPLLNVTLLLPGVVSNPVPVMVTDVSVTIRLVVTAVTTGAIFATWTAAPLPTPLVVTNAFMLPPAVGAVLMSTVKLVAVAAETVPIAPLSNKTILLAGVVALNPKPLMVNVEPLTPMLAVLLVITGMIVATCGLEPFEMEFVVTDAVKLPTDVGLVVYVTVRRVAVAVVTLPTAPLLNVTTFRDAVVSNPKPLISMVDALKPTPAVLPVTTGITDAI